MTPFREKPIKWNENTDPSDNKFKNKNGYKYDIISQTVVTKTEDMPKFFLADTPKEAEHIYAQFEGIINKLAYSYSKKTNIDRSDLFGEALIGLARAYRDWDPNRSNNFKTFAIFIIKDTLNEYVRNNISLVSIPSYVKKANNNLTELIHICNNYDIDWKSIVIDLEKIPEYFKNDDIDRCNFLLSNLINAAERAKTPFNDFIHRIEVLPSNNLVTEQMDSTDCDRNSEKMEAVIVVEQLKKHMDEVELCICEGIMAGKSFDEIGSGLGKSKAWISNKIKSLREKVLLTM